MKRKKQRRIKPLLFVVVGAVLVVALWWVFGRTDSTGPVANTEPEPTTQTTTKPKQTKTTLRLIATGDMLPHDTVNQAARTATGYDYRPIFSNVSQYLRDADMAYCNQESPSAKQFSVSGYPTFNAPTEFAQDLSDEGCNIINLANNHANDRGQAGINGTLNVWDSLPTLAVAGTARNSAGQDRIAYFTKGGIKFAYLGYSKCSNSTLANSYGLNLLSRSLFNSQLAEARAGGAQMIIVGTHWCRENISTQTAEQDEWANYFASKGVDIVIGTGPHWLQPVKSLPRAGGGKTIVWFSLGNFLSTQLELNGLIGGIAVMDIDISSHSVTDVGFMPTYMHYEWTASEKARGDLLARHNLKLYPLDQAAGALARSQNHTSVSAQTRRVTDLMNKYTDVTMLTSKTYASFGR
ncbi:CapA family protein [Candidatus Saccharibacteria bacterium]|nr:CapA family protein [Candidatus Saccharibacteria bacterium]